MTYYMSRYMAQAGSAMFIFSVASSVIMLIDNHSDTYVFHINE